MSASSVLTYPPSAPRRRLVRWAVLERPQRIAQLPVLAMLVAWFAYTRAYFFLHPHGLTFDPSIFMYLTRKPDPTCGLTRTFAWTWRGDLGEAVRVYPLGPLLFLGAAALVIYLGITIVTGRRLVVVLPRQLWWSLVALSLVALAANWTAKLIWLGI